jgi:oligosaccharyltransferase complex subunit beta
MDPFVRDYLVKTEGAEQKLEFKLPHTYGVFKFIIQYKRVGYTYIQFEEIVPVRPLQHTQYERFITAAYPYYAASGSMLVGLFAFSCVFLYHK